MSKQPASSTQQQGDFFEYLIIGGGPAGLQIGYYLEQAQQDYCIIEQGEQAGTFFKRFPRHGTLISINKVNTGYKNPETNLRWDWNSLLTDDYSLLFKDYSTKFYPDSEDLVRYFQDFVEKYNINIKCNQNVLKISKDSKTGFFTVKSQNTTYKCKYLIVATGLSRPNIPNIKGIELVTQYFDLDTDTKQYTDKRVLIIGKGNSGFETANHLVESASLIHVVSPDPLKFAFNSRYPGHLRSINATFMDTYLLKQQNGILNAEIVNIKKAVNPKNKNQTGLDVTVHYSNAHDEVETIYYDDVICCTGFRFNSDIFDSSCMPRLVINDRFPEMTTYYESTNVPNLFYTGNITQSLDFKQKQSAFIHGFRYNAQFLAKFLLSNNNHASLIDDTLAINPRVVQEHIIKQINQNSALWQQTGYMSLAYVFNKAKGCIEYIPNVPLKYIIKTNHLQNKFALIVTLDFGECIKHPDFDALTHNRVHKEDFEQAYNSSVIHPIVKLIYGGKEIANHHILEDFENEWLEEVHTEPLSRFLKHCFNYIGNIFQGTGKSKA